MPMKQEVNVPLVLTIGIVSGVLLVVMIIGTEAWYRSEEQSEIAAKAREYPYQPLIDLKASGSKRISEYRWVDRNNGVVAIPIERAMQIMVQTQGHFPSTQPSASAGPGT
ncbi:MAG: hypothetical protein ABR964_07185 [Tepidisphaeraceae bacterium]|jgi:hypothetical protein